MTEPDYPCSPLVAANAIVARYLAEKESLDEAALHLASVLLACTRWRVDDDELVAASLRSLAPNADGSLAVNAEFEPIVRRFRRVLTQLAPYFRRRLVERALEQPSLPLARGRRLGEDAFLSGRNR